MSERLQTCQSNKLRTDSLVLNQSKLLDKNRKPLVSRPPLIQTKLAINKPGDQYEQEADRIADQVMRMPDPVLQRKCAKCSEDEENVLQAKGSPGQEPVAQVQNVPPLVHEVLRSPGQQIDEKTRAFMESRFGHDFSKVRVHIDEKAAVSARVVNALAYTVGRDVVFGMGQYLPQTSKGQYLLAHELAHVVQQGSRNQFGTGLLNISQANDVAERKADTVGASIANDGPSEAIAQNVPMKIQRLLPSATSSQPVVSTAKPCPTSAQLTTVRQFNHSNLSASDQTRFRTYLGAITRMDLSPGPDYTGHCAKEKLFTIANNCPSSLTSATSPCSKSDCLPVNKSGGDGPTRTFINSGPAAFLDLHRSRSERSLLEGTGVNACSIVCRQKYYCDTLSGPHIAGEFEITRNYETGTFTPPGGTAMHITTGTVNKIQISSPSGDYPLRILPGGQEFA